MKAHTPTTTSGVAEVYFCICSVTWRVSGVASLAPPSCGNKDSNDMPMPKQDRKTHTCQQLEIVEQVFSPMSIAA